MHRLCAYAFTLMLMLTITFGVADDAQACRDYDGHRNSVVAPSCGAQTSGYGSGYGSGDIHSAIDAVGLPYAFHAITERESGSGADLYNEASGACGYFQFLPSTAAYMGYSCYDLYDPYTSAQAAYELYQIAGFSPWALTYY